MSAQSLCLDANVFVASMVPEESHHEISLKLLSWVQGEGALLHEPALVLFEVLSTLHRKVLLGELSPFNFDKARELFFELPLLLQWRPRHLERASRIAATLSFKNIYDASYLAIAQSRKIPLVSLDQELIQKGKKVYSRLLTVDDFLKTVV